MLLLRIAGFAAIAAATAMPAVGAPNIATAAGWLVGLMLLVTSYRSPGRGRCRRRS